MASEQTRKRFAHLASQRVAKQEQLIRLMVDIDGIDAAIDELFDGREGKAALVELVTALNPAR